MILLDGKIVGSSDQLILKTREEYEALSDEVKNNGNAYFTPDDYDTEYTKLVHMGFVIGNDEELSGYADGTIVGAILDLYDRLGGLSLRLDANNNIEFVYNDEEVTPAEPAGNIEYLTDADKINHIEDVIGSEDDLYNLGHPTIVSAIKSLYARLNGISMTYNDTEETLKISYSDDTPK